MSKRINITHFFNRRKTVSVFVVIMALIVTSFSFYEKEESNYFQYYTDKISDYLTTQNELLETIRNTHALDSNGIDAIKRKIWSSRLKLKGIDFWVRYLEPIAYKSMNGAIPVEWETEVFEKYENPYYREGGGLTLMELYLGEEEIQKDTLIKLIEASLVATKSFQADTNTVFLRKHDHFFLSNRLFLLNLAAIYTTGFECPEADNIFPEIASMLNDVRAIYTIYNKSFRKFPVRKEFLNLYDRMITFVNLQPKKNTDFNFFTFIRDYVNPLFAMNQKMIVDYRTVSKSYVDYSLSRSCQSIFDKALYRGQNHKGIFIAVDDPAMLAEIRQIGKLLFYDPRLSGNNKRSCASCHKPTEYFTDTLLATSPHFDPSKSLSRNTPSLINVVNNHLLMYDGRHTTLQNQAKDVTTNMDEMASTEKEILEKLLSCREYRTAFEKFIKHTSENRSVTFNHIVSALTFYYSDFSLFSSPFDDAMNKKGSISPAAIQGFNLSMSKAECATCHFVPAFNGVKPPYIETEFEVLGVPADSGFLKFDGDSGRYNANPAKEMVFAFRTTTLRNSFHTKPYMHNGVFFTLEQVIDFYNVGGGAGKGFTVPNQTLSSDSLLLTPLEQAAILEFIRSLDEKILFEDPPGSLPLSDIKELNDISVGGVY